MEIIQLTGYTEFEKLNIAREVPDPAAEEGMRPRGRARRRSRENAIRTVIHHYTREAGVRSLEREIATICRKVARQGRQRGQGASRSRSAAQTCRRILGVPKFRLGKKEEHDEIGLTNGLRGHDHGGELLACEVSVVAGKGKLVITGLLEKGMEESAQAAMSYVRSRARSSGSIPTFTKRSTCTCTSRSSSARTARARA